MVSIKDVAEAAGVSTATVSRVLANGKHVRPEVRTRVMAAVEQLGYRPNLIARSLRSQRSTTIGLLVSDIANPFFTSLSRAVEDKAYEQGYTVLLCNTDENAEKERIYLNLMQDTNVAGVIISPTKQTITSLKRKTFPFPIVIVDRAIVDVAFDSVQLDNIDAGYQLTRHLLEQGYRRIAVLYSEMSTGQERLRGYEKALQAHGMSVKHEYIKHVPPKDEAGYMAALHLLTLPDPPDALFTVNSLLAAGAMQAIRERQLSIPDDIALVTFDQTTWTELVQPAITLISQPTYEIGRTATELVLQRIGEPERPARQIILKGQLLIQGSSIRHIQRAE